MDKLSETSRIGKTYLLAIEGNDMRSLPAPVFLRGFLVQIAKHLGLDEKLVVGSYLSRVKDQTKK
jgi:cytoskeletal protein RodZ